MPSPTSLSAVRQDAIARRDRGDLNSARTLLDRALEAATMTSGEDHPEVLTTAHLLASLHRQAGDLSAARRVLENALYAGTNRHGEEHPLMLAISFELAEIADELGNRHEARRHYTRVAKWGPSAVNFNQQQVQAARAWLGPSAPAPAAPVQGGTVTLPAPEPLQPPRPPTTPMPPVMPPVNPAPATMPQTGSQTGPARPVPDDDFGLGPATSPPRFGPATKQPPVPQPVPPQPMPPQPVPQQPMPPQVAQQPVAQQPVAPPPMRPREEQTQPVPPQLAPPRQAPVQGDSTVPLPSQTQPPVVPQQTPAKPQQQAPQQPPAQPVPMWPVPQGRQGPPNVTQQGLPTPRPPQLNPPSTTTYASHSTAYPSSPVALGPQQPPLLPAGRQKRGRGMLIGSLLAAVVAVAAAGAAVYLVLNNSKNGQNPGADTLPPTNVAIVVRDDRVTLTWNDPSNGVAQPIIVGSRESEGLRRFAMPGKGSTEAVIPGLNKNFDYCFAVVLVYSEDDLKQSEQVCTDRKKASPSPSR